tara:strand:+ start:246 stop:536 length:291 start_codon:yes stop_codon:yes gene_type:complete
MLAVEYVLLCSPIRISKQQPTEEHHIKKKEKQMVTGTTRRLSNEEARQKYGDSIIFVGTPITTFTPCPEEEEMPSPEKEVLPESDGSEDGLPSAKG